MEENDFMSPDDWIAELEGIRMEMEDCDSEATMTDKDFMGHISNNLPLGYDAILVKRNWYYHVFWRSTEFNLPPTEILGAYTDSSKTDTMAADATAL